MRVKTSVVLGLLFATGCGMLRGGSGGTTNLPSGSWTGQVIGTSFSGSNRISGRVSLIPGGGGRARAEIELRNMPHPSRHPWFVINGSCGESNPTEISSRAVPEIESRPDRTGSLATTIPVSLQSGGLYSVVFLLDRTSNTVVGCAALTEVG